jgi:HPt (histidine-containing phosphotransfer) domain-containing protein
MSDEDTAIAVADPFARRLMIQYLGRRQRDIKTLSRYLAQDEFERIVLTAHKLYGSGSAYGLDEISRLGGELEAAARSRESDAVEALIGELQNYIRHLKLS